MTPISEEMKRYRREHFATMLEPAVEPCEPGELTLRVTKNGTQWPEQITLTPREQHIVLCRLLEAEQARMPCGVINRALQYLGHLVMHEEPWA